MSMTSNKDRIAGNKHKSHQKRSVPSGRAMTATKRENAAEGLLEALRKAGTDVLAAAYSAEALLAKADEGLTRYTLMVSDDGEKVRYSIVGMRDMDITASVARIARTSVTMLGRLIGGREARALAVAVEDMTRLASMAGAISATHVHALKECTEAIERISA